MHIKMQSIGMHKSQVRANGELWVQGVKGRAMYRGYQVNAEYAEAFEVVKAIDVYFNREQQAGDHGDASARALHD
jgi:hypothetical protein